MKITKLTAENVKRLSAVEVTPDPDGNLVIVGGPNAAGKSSVLDSIMYGLAGVASIPSQPIRRGAKRAKISIELDGEKSLTVERTMKPTGGALVVKAKGKAAPLSSPQALLDSLCGKIAFDPLEFTRLKQRDQQERLRGLVGLDFTEHDTKRKEVFDERTAVNRDAKSLKAQIDAVPDDPEAPAEEVSVTKLVAELQRRQDVNAKNEQTRCALAEREGDAERQQYDVEARKSRIAAMERQLEKERKALGQATLDAHLAAQQVATKKKEVAALQDENTAEVEKQIAESDSLNLRVRAQRERRNLVERLTAKNDQSDRLTEQLAGLDTEKQHALESAQWPVEGLGFDEDGVTYNGLPFEQAGSAEALKVSVAIGAALNPILRVMLIRDGSLLDDESLTTIAQLAQERDLQLWIERVGEGEECSVVIQDGAVKQEDESDAQE